MPGRLLYDESPLVVQPTLAKAIGLNEAIILQQIHYWMKKEASGKVIDGVHWMFNSLSAWQEQFPWWSESTIYRTLESLEKLELIKTGSFNRRKGDRTKWYTLNYAVYHELEAKVAADEQAAEAAKQGGRNSVFHNEPSSSQDGTTLPESSSEISSSLPLYAIETDLHIPQAPLTPKQKAWDAFEAASKARGITIFGNTKLLVHWNNAFDKNQDHWEKRQAACFQELTESGNPFRAVDKIIQYNPNPKPAYVPRPAFQRSGAPPATKPKPPLNQQLEDYYQLRPDMRPREVNT